MPGSALAVLEEQMRPLTPHFAQVLGKIMPVERLMRTVMVSVERLPKLLECDRQSILNSAMSAACLGLEVDGVTGQAYLIPFKGKAQLVIGYKGFNTLAARSGITITGAVVREGDQFEYELGSDAFVKHVPALGGKGARRIIAAWACAKAKGRPPVVHVMDVDELMAVKARSPGAQKSDSPWNDPAIGWPAMCEKTVKRRLARSLPLNVMQYAARLDEAVDEQGAAAWISPDSGVIVEGEVIPPRHTANTPTADDLIGQPSPKPTSPILPPGAAADAAAPQQPQGGAAAVPTAEAYVERWHGLVDSASNIAQADQMAKAWKDEKPTRNLIDWPDSEDHPHSWQKLHRKVSGAIAMLKEPTA